MDKKAINSKFYHPPLKTHSIADQKFQKNYKTLFNQSPGVKLSRYVWKYGESNR